MTLLFTYLITPFTLNVETEEEPLNFSDAQQRSGTDRGRSSQAVHTSNQRERHNEPGSQNSAKPSSISAASAAA